MSISKMSEQKYTSGCQPVGKVCNQAVGQSIQNLVISSIRMPIHQCSNGFAVNYCIFKPSFPSANLYYLIK